MMNKTKPMKMTWNKPDDLTKTRKTDEYWWTTNNFLWRPKKAICSHNLFLLMGLFKVFSHGWNPDTHWNNTIHDEKTRLIPMKRNEHNDPDEIERRLKTNSHSNDDMNFLRQLFSLPNLRRKESKLTLVDQKSLYIKSLLYYIEEAITEDDQTLNVAYVSNYKINGWRLKGWNTYPKNWKILCDKNQWNEKMIKEKLHNIPLLNL